MHLLSCRFRTSTIVQDHHLLKTLLWTFAELECKPSEERFASATSCEELYSAIFISSNRVSSGITVRKHWITLGIKAFLYLRGSARYDRAMDSIIGSAQVVFYLNQGLHRALAGKFELLSNETRSSTPEAPSRISKMDNLRVRSSTQSAYQLRSSRQLSWSVPCLLQRWILVAHRSMFDSEIYVCLSFIPEGRAASASTFSTTTEPQLAVFETIGESLSYTEQKFSLMNVPSRHSQRTQRLVGKSVHPQRSMGMEELIVQDAFSSSRGPTELKECHSIWKESRVSPWHNITLKEKFLQGRSSL